MKNVLIVILLGALTACRGAAPAGKQYPLIGQVMAIDATRSEVTVDHKDIPNFMPAMTMAYKVKDPAVLKTIEPGDLVTATLVVQNGEAWLTSITKTGHATPRAGARPTRVMDVMQPGDLVPDDGLVDQDGKARKLSDWRGKAVAVTFVYTRCPLPNFCPLMERNFAEVQHKVAADPVLRGHVRLAAISFDPEHDTPAVLKARAALTHADPAVWSYLTGAPETIDHVTERFGVSATPEPDTTITHNLRTAIIDPRGRVATIYTGNEWTTDQMVDALRHALTVGG